MITSKPQIDQIYFETSKFVRYLFSKLKVFLLASLIGGLLFLGLSYYFPDKYKSEIALIPNNSDSSSLNNLANQFGGLASLAGINVDSSKDKSIIALNILTSRKFIVDFVKKHHIEAFIVAAKNWDSKTQQFEFNEELYSAATNKWLPRPNSTDTFYPTDREIYQSFKNLVSYNTDKASKVTTVAFSFLNPDFAQKWLTWLIQDLNNSLKNDEIVERKKQIAFLQQALKNEQNADIRNVFFNLIQEQIKSITLTKATDEYVFKTIDPAYFPEVKYFPIRSLLFILGGIVGAILGFVGLLIAFLFKSRSN